MEESRIQDIEIHLFLDALFRRYGYDFRHYAKASLKRRVLATLAATPYSTLAELIPRLLRDEDYLAEVIAQLSVPVTEMFRDPHVFKALRENVLPVLKTHPRFNVWQAGCATGEEVYSLAIMLDEEGLLERAQIYATDINEKALHNAEDGIFSMQSLPEYQRNYQHAGGRARFSDYYVANAGFFRIHERLRSRIVFAHHNLVSDGVFCEVQLILCRNVLIYFDNELQKHVLGLFHESLARSGFLCLGTRESLRTVEAQSLFAPVDRVAMIYRKNGIHA
ncbi:protein-glutamate O-methyltransferase CheR [Candidatus Methylospira mobilis]|uniref:Protein-glutamate O-methyltransferase CheR n=2 Tax=Candidatus Methylospira mobilis TaxID=1808979 RepID=A0A5Q0BPM3_9GAMM|nr:protein-glutamate O-methyltransferase CheR [Candidatus Methylospira mobilis]